MLEQMHDATYSPKVFFFFSLGPTTPSWPGPPHSRGF